jgi:hypothetical protein
MCDASSDAFPAIITPITSTSNPIDNTSAKIQANTQLYWECNEVEFIENLGRIGMESMVMFQPATNQLHFTKKSTEK